LHDFLATPEKLLTAIAVVLLGLYFVLFFLLVTRHANDAAVLRADQRGKRNNLLMVPIAIAAVIAPLPYSLVAIGLGMVVLAGFEWTQRKRLARAGAGPAFLRRLSAVSGIAWVAFAAYGMSALLVALRTTANG
jgi:hypothetical protein